MAILDFLVPDLAPEQYSSGQGTGYAQEYDLGAPNPFDVAQDYMNNMLQQKKLEQEKDLLNEKTRQEKLNQYISSIEYDPKWEIARSNFDEKVNEIGDFVSEWRASGKPINQDFNMELNKRKAELNTMKSENEKAFETYNKNMQTMLAGLGKDYTQEDIKAYEKSVTDAYDRGGINEGFKTITTIRPLKEFNVSGHFSANFPKPESSADGRTSDQVKEELDNYTNNRWMDLTPDRQRQIVDDLYYGKKIDENTPDAAINYIRNNVVELYNQKRVGVDKTKPFSITEHFSKNYPQPESLDALNSDQLKSELDSYNNTRWADLDETQEQNLINNLYDEGLIENPTKEEAKNYTRNVVDYYNRKVKRQGRVGSKSYGSKVAEKVSFIPDSEYETSEGRNDYYNIEVPNPQNFQLEDGTYVYMKPDKLVPFGEKGVYLEGTRLAVEGDKSFWETQKEAEDALSKWEESNKGQGTIEQDPKTKKFYITSGERVKVPVGRKIKESGRNRGLFKAAYNHDLEEEYRKLAKPFEDAGEKDWFNRVFYGTEGGSSQSSQSSGGASRFNPKK
jgi:hypothetical protein